MPKFAANLTMLYQEYPLLERIERAANAGFTGVEILYPYGQDIDAIKTALESRGLELVLFNVPSGNVAAGDRGIANDPRRIDEYRAAVDLALTVQRTLPAKRFNSGPLAGTRTLAAAGVSKVVTAAGLPASDKADVATS